MDGREKMYSHGGIFSITSRILVVDLLSSMVPRPHYRGAADISELLNPETVTGLVVLHSERYGSRMKCGLRSDSSQGSLQRPSKLSSSEYTAR